MLTHEYLRIPGRLESGWKEIVDQEALFDHQKSTARITGALAHELNNPLQGVLSILSVFSREYASDDRCQLRLEQIRSGLTRVSRIVESFSVAYENLPRSPDRTTAERFLELVKAALNERQLRAQVECSLPGEAVFFCMSPELARLIGDAFSIPSTENRSVLIQMRVVQDRVELIVKRGGAGADSSILWQRLDDHNGLSGVAGLINEIARLGGGDAEFRFDELTLCGIRLLFRTNMNSM